MNDQNLGLYAERAGTFSMVCASPEEKERVMSQIKRVVRPLYSSPPIHGAQLVATILGTPELYDEWYVTAADNARSTDVYTGLPR